MTQMRTSRILLILLAGAIIGWGIFGVLVWRAVEIEEADESQALRRFHAVRTALPSEPPLLDLDPAGDVIRGAPTGAAPDGTLASLSALAYQPRERRLVHARMPFWFFTLKAPAAEYVFRGTGLDLKRLGVTAEELRRHGPAIVIDHVYADGRRLLVWTE
jgi:hypothetical protein